MVMLYGLKGDDIHFILQIFKLLVLTSLVGQLISRLKIICQQLCGN